MYRSAISRLSPNGCVALLLIVWWLCNLLLGAVVELADDEAYYWAWTTVASEHGSPWAWGYFDHPPMVAWLINLSSWLPGSLGVRFASLLLLPCALYLFWVLIRPAHPSWRDAWTFVAVCFAMPFLQLYGLLALPDAPLLFFTVVFLWAFQRFAFRQSWANTFLLGLAAVLLAYSKYHGFLVIVFALLSRPRLFKTYRLYVAALLALLLFSPHLWWQHQHHWTSLRYHLFDRNTSFSWHNLGDFLLSLLVVFNPLLWGYVLILLSQRTFRRPASLAVVPKALCFLVLGFLLFFAVSSCHKYVQVQWVLPIVFAAVWAFWLVARQGYARGFRRMMLVVVVLFFVARVFLWLNPFDFKGQIWHNRASCAAIHSLAASRPVLFSGDYTAAAKYAFYSGSAVFSQPLFYGRDSQWSLASSDTALVGHDVLVQVDENDYADTLFLPNGRLFRYVTLYNYRPLRRVAVCFSCPGNADSSLNALSVPVVDTLHLSLLVYNPYDYDIFSAPITAADASNGSVQEEIGWNIFFKISQREQPECFLPLSDTLRAHSSTRVTLDVPLPAALQPNRSYDCAVSLMYRRCDGSRNSPWLSLTLSPQS